MSTRRLAAILVLDVVGYSRLIGIDEVGTIESFKRHRRELIDPTIAEHLGRIVNTAGDGMLIEFPSVVEAVTCSIVVQRGMLSRNSRTTADRRIVFRAGINLGDVIVEGDDILGDGVNVAARLEAMCEPGGVWLSLAAWDHARDRLPIDFADLGEHAAKNIARPIRVFALQANAIAELPLRPETSRRAGGSGEASDPRSVIVRAFPDKPSIAVLPFANVGRDPEHEYFADGIVEDIITALSRFRKLFVVARNSSSGYKGKPVDVRQVGRELGVRYVLEGSVRKAVGRVRITAQLVDSTSGAHLWAEHFDGALTEIFNLQDDVTERVVGAIEPSLWQAEVDRARRKRPESLDAYEHYLRALPQAQVGMPGDAENALSWLQRSLALQPDYAPAHAGAAWCYAQRYLRSRMNEDDKSTALFHARSAIEFGSDDAETLATAGFVIGLVKHDYEGAMNAIDQALVINNSSALVYGLGATILAHAGATERAIAYGERALRLSPHTQTNYLSLAALGIAHLIAGHLEEAAEVSNRAAQANPRVSLPRVLQASALSRLGRTDEAKTAARRVLELEPFFSVRKFVMSHTSRPEIWNVVGETLRQVGLPD